MTWHCDITKNPVGTDTVMIGAPPCDCQGCRAAARIEALEAALRERDTLIEAADDLYAAYAGFARTDGQHEAMSNFSTASNTYRAALRTGAGEMSDESIWCPGCSREVDGPCHHFNCAVGPHGLDAQIKTAARIEALEKALREIKQLALSCKPAETPAALAHMVRICIDAGITRAALAPEQDK